MDPSVPWVDITPRVRLRAPVVVEFSVGPGNTWAVEGVPLAGWSPRWRLPLMLALPLLHALLGVLLIKWAKMSARCGGRPQHIP